MWLVCVDICFVSVMILLNVGILNWLLYVVLVGCICGICLCVCSVFSLVSVKFLVN